MTALGTAQRLVTRYGTHSAYALARAKRQFWGAILDDPRARIPSPEFTTAASFNTFWAGVTSAILRRHATP